MRRQGIVERVLKDGRGITLWAAAAIAESLEVQNRVEILGRRLREPLYSGCEYLMSALEDDLTAGNEAYDLLRHCFMADQVFVAVEAAKAALRLSDTAGGDLIPVLTSAYEFWLEHEEPYPKGGGNPSRPKTNLARGDAKDIAAFR